MNNVVDTRRRKFLLRATSILGVIGAGAAGIPFVSSLLPSAKAIAEGGPIIVKIDQMKPGDQLTVFWRSRPVWIVYRTPEILDHLKFLSPLLRDPDSEIPQQPAYTQNFYRSRKAAILVLVGVCTHLGCTPTYRPEPKSVDIEWPGGFFCSCHGSKFDMAGRVFKGVPAPINLEVPPYVFINDTEIMIGVDEIPKDINHGK